MSVNDSGASDGFRALERAALQDADPLTAVLPPVTDPIPVMAGRYQGHRSQQTMTVPVAAVRIMAIVAPAVALSVVLSVVATITLISVMNAGVILPQYSRYNQPAKVTQLGLCVSRHHRIWTPQHVGFCHGGRFVHVQPSISHP